MASAVYLLQPLRVVAVRLDSFRLLRSVTTVPGDEAASGQARLEAVEEEETVRMHLAALRREEAALQASIWSRGLTVLFFLLLLSVFIPCGRARQKYNHRALSKYRRGGFIFTC